MINDLRELKDRFSMNNFQAQLIVLFHYFTISANSVHVGVQIFKTQEYIYVSNQVFKEDFLLLIDTKKASLIAVAYMPRCIN